VLAETWHDLADRYCISKKSMVAGKEKLSDLIRYDKISL